MLVRIPEPPRRTLPVNASQSPVLFGLADDSADRLVCGAHDRRGPRVTITGDVPVFLCVGQLGRCAPRTAASTFRTPSPPQT